MAFSIIAVTTGVGGSFTIGGDKRTKFPNNIEFRVFGSTLNDDRYNVQSTSLIAGTSVSGFQVVNLGDNDLPATQEVNVGGAVNAGTATGLANDATVFTADIVINGGTSQPIAVTGSAAQTFGALIIEINADLTNAVAELVAGNILVSSTATGDETSVSITDTDLFSSLTPFVAINTAVPGGVTLSGFQTVNVGGAIANTNSTGLDDNGVREVTDVTAVADVAGSLNSTFFNLDTPGTDYYVWYNVSGGGVDPNPGGRVGIEVAISTGDTANAVAGATSAEIDQEADLIATFSLAVVTVTNVAKGAVPDATDGAAPTGFGFVVTQQGSDGTVYTADVSVDGGGAQPLAIPGSNAQTYLELINKINDVIDVGGTSGGDDATAAVVDGNVRITSVTTGTGSTVSITDTGGSPLFGSLNDFVEILTAVTVTSTGLPNDATVFTASVVIDGGGAQPIAVTGSAAQNYSDLLAEINTDIAGATATIDSDRNLRITSATFDPTSTVAITDTDLFSSLNLFQAINTAVPGEDDTEITVFSDVPDATVDGDVFLPGSYLLEFTDDSVNPSFMLEPETIDGPPGTTTSLSLIGRGTLNYGEPINENFLHLLENFASDGTEPTDPIIGQLWYDDSINLLKIFDGAFNPLATGSTLTIQDEGVAIPNSPHSTLNFIGSGVVATDSGGGIADITISVTSAGTIINDADGDTAIDVEDTADEDVIRFDTGDTPAGYGAVVDIMTLASSGLTISMGTANVVATAGAPISITAGTGNTTGDGGDISLVPGAGGASGEDGVVILNTTTFKELTTETVSAGATVIGSVAIPTNTSVLFEVLGVGRETGGQTIAKRIFGSIQNTGGTTALVGSTSEDRTDSGGAAVDWDITAVADDAGDELDLTVDDGGTETVEWKVSVKFLSVTQ